jgi:hypothetical protein
VPAARPAALQSRPECSTTGAHIASGQLQPRYEGMTFSDSSVTNILSERSQPDYAAAAQAPWNRPALLPMTPQSSTSIELESMRSKVTEVEHQRQQSRNATPSVITPVPATSFHVTSGLAGPIDVLQDSRTLGQAYPISRGISHKNRVFGQSHWMNGFVVLRDVVELLEPQMRGGTSTLPAGMHRAKIHARPIGQHFPHKIYHRRTYVIRLSSIILGLSKPCIGSCTYPRSCGNMKHCGLADQILKQALWYK